MRGGHRVQVDGAPGGGTHAFVVHRRISVFHCDGRDLMCGPIFFFSFHHSFPPKHHA